ncbi:MAG: RpiB/LacA/LacB family sugar-phosphate isomerase [Candidatus Paceibacterota bacterium]|jgi:ribose 5-phosphate isomerase B
MKNKTIVLASDHAGYELKQAVKSFLLEKGYQIEDVGATSYKEGDDYPEYMAKAASMIAMDQTGLLIGILFGGSGQGEAMVANRFPGVRATVWYGDVTSTAVDGGDIISLSREHNDANVLSIGARFVSEENTKATVLRWLETAFGGDERHARRNVQIDSIE